jgi:Na+/proline symporter
MVLFYLAIYVLIVVGVSYYFSQKNNEDDFLIAGRNRPLWQLMCSKIAATMGTGFFLLYTAYTYQYGWSTLVLIGCFAISFLAFAFWAVPQIYRSSREQNFLTIGDFVSHRFGNRLPGTILNRVMVVFVFIWIVSTFIGGAKIISAYVGITYDAAILVSLVFVAGYVYLSGYRAVLATDVVQAVVMLGLLGLATFGLASSADMGVIASTLGEPLPIELLIGIAVFGFFSVFSGIDRYQLVYSAKTEKIAVWSSALGIIPFAIAFIPLILIGLYMRVVAPGGDPDIVFMQFLTNHTSPVFFELAAVMLVAGLMSTLDTWLYAIATHLRPLHNVSPATAVQTVRWNMLIASVFLAATAFVFRDLLSIAILGVIVIVTTSVAMLYVFSHGKYPERFIASVAGGVLGATVAVIVLGPIPEALPAPILGSLLGLLVPVKLLKKVLKA